MYAGAIYIIVQAYLITFFRALSTALVRVKFVLYYFLIYIAMEKNPIQEITY